MNFNTIKTRDVDYGRPRLVEKIGTFTPKSPREKESTARYAKREGDSSFVARRQTRLLVKLRKGNAHGLEGCHWVRKVEVKVCRVHPPELHDILR